MFGYVVPLTVVTKEKLLQDEPWHRSISYPASPAPPESVEPLQLKSIREPETTEALSPDGVVGEAVSGNVFPDTLDEYPE